MQNVWIFNFTEPLDEAAAQTLAAKLQEHLSQWKTHGTPVQSRVALRYAHFLFVEAVTDVSGCSIDWLQHTVLGIVQELGLVLADHSRIFFWRDELVESIDFRELEPALLSGKLTADTVVFDHRALQNGEFDRWEVPLRNTWMSRYMPYATSPHAH